MELEGSVAAVTGASSGIGAATAIALARDGASVALLARRVDRLEAVAADIERAGGVAQVVPVDVRDGALLTEAIDEVAYRCGRLDILVNNAGVGYWERTVDANPADWRHEVEVNLVAPMFATSAAVPHMLARGAGHIVNVSSLASRGPGPSWAGYAASKAGLNIFSESVQADLRGNGIKVTLVETGEVATEMQTDDDIASIPMLLADDVADAILFALTRPGHVCIADIQMFAPTAGGAST
jgi:NADP-dependent 3-hydroxy acid dehydrogenase YdfG